MHSLPPNFVDEDDSQLQSNHRNHRLASSKPPFSFSPDACPQGPRSSYPHHAWSPWSPFGPSPLITSPPLPQRIGFQNTPFQFSFPFPSSHNCFGAPHPDRSETTSGGVFTSCQQLHNSTSTFASPPQPLFFPPPPTVQPPARILVDTWRKMEPPPFLRLPTSRDGWLADARSRRAAYTHSFALPALRWVLVEDGEHIPEDAVQTGSEATDEPLYSVRTWHNGGLHLGKGGHHIFKGSSVSWGSQEYAFGTFEVLVGDPSLAQWVNVPFTPRFEQLQEDVDIPPSPISLSPLVLTPLASPSALPTLTAPKRISSSTLFGSTNSRNMAIRPFFAIEGGFEPTTSSFSVDNDFLPAPPSSPTAPLATLFIAQAFYANGWHPGKVEAGDDHCCVGWGGGEVWVKEFRVLSWAL